MSALTSPIAIAVVRKNGLEEIRVSLTSYHNVPLVDVRTFADFGSGDERKPTKKGVSVKITALPELRAALAQAEHEAKRLGLHSDKEGQGGRSMTSALSLREIAHMLGGELAGQQVVCPGPGHSPRDRSLSVRLDPRAPGGLLVHSFANDDALLCKDFVRERLGLERKLSHCPAPLERGTVGQDHPDSERTVRALALWAETRDPAETPVEVYLRGRGFPPIPPIGGAIRYHPSCPFAGRRTPAMVCLVRDIVTDEPKAMHRTALSLDGHKVKIGDNCRLSLGPVSGGAIKLTPDEDVTTCLGIGEGLESALSLRLAPEFGPSPVWSLLSAGGVGRFPVLAGVECLWIAVDHDPAGMKAARTCAERWRAAGREVFLVKPTAERADLNDTVTGRTPHA
jgi:putative DNA primase/helicase